MCVGRPRLCVFFVVVLAIFGGYLITKVNHMKTQPRFRGIIPAFTRNYNYHYSDIPDLSGKVAIVTGANAGLGFSTAKTLASRGAKTVIVCRSEKKCAKTATKLEELSDKFDIVAMGCDLGDLSSVRNFALTFLERFDRLDMLILNAGVMRPPHTLSKDGLELQFAVNHVANHYLSKLLLPLLQKSSPSTVVSVASSASFNSVPTGIYLTEEELNAEDNYDTGQYYGQSKLANVLFAQELAEQVIDSRVYVNAIHPGAVQTELGRHVLPVFLADLIKSVLGLLIWHPDEACLTQVYAATSPEIFEKEIHGKYIIPIADVSDCAEHAKNLTLQKALWQFTEDILEKRGFK